MRGQEKVFDKEEIKAILDNLAVAVVLIASLLMALYIIMYQNRSAELQNTGMLASTLGGAISSLAGAPDRGVYCVMMPGTQAYYIVLGKVDASEAGDGSKMRAFISAYSPERGTTGIFYLPFFGFTPGSSHVPSGKPYVVAFRKAGVSDPITMEAVEGSIDTANCDTAIASTTTPTATATATPTSGIIISGGGGDIVV